MVKTSILAQNKDIKLCQDLYERSDYSRNILGVHDTLSNGEHENMPF